MPVTKRTKNSLEVILFDITVLGKIWAGCFSEHSGQHFDVCVFHRQGYDRVLCKENTFKRLAIIVISKFMHFTTRVLCKENTFKWLAIIMVSKFMHFTTISFHSISFTLFYIVCGHIRTYHISLNTAWVSN